uniref:WAP domain-containing protein n=1 Tax=Syphacia muris TaxID=451379 RepID=A0A0N5ATQ1_9BILA
MTSKALNDLVTVSSFSSFVSPTSQDSPKKGTKNVLLKQKRKRYRCLRKAMKEIRWFLELNRDKKDVKGQKCRSSCKWKKRFLAKWKRLNARVKKLEIWRRKKFHSKSRNGKLLYDSEIKDDQFKKSRHRSTISWVPSSNPETTTDNREEDPNLRILFSSANQSLNGEYGRPCKAHRDCKAGLCCHRYSGNVTVSSPICILYKLHENDLCKDTCQCEAHLHCILNSSPSQSTNNPGLEVPFILGVCKKVSKINFGNGKYLDAKMLVFSD